MSTRRWFLVALLVLLTGGVVIAITSEEDPGESEPAPPELIAQLPLKYGIGNLCRGADSPPWLVRRLNREVDVLVREIDRHPDWVVPYTIHYEGGDQETLELTISELGERVLDDLSYAEVAGSPCAPEVRERIESALG